MTLHEFYEAAQRAFRVDYVAEVRVYIGTLQDADGQRPSATVTVAYRGTYLYGSGATPEVALTALQNDYRARIEPQQQLADERDRLRRRVAELEAEITERRESEALTCRKA